MVLCSRIEEHFRFTAVNPMFSLNKDSINHFFILSRRCQSGHRVSLFTDFFKLEVKFQHEPVSRAIGPSSDKPNLFFESGTVHLRDLSHDPTLINNASATRVVQLQLWLTREILWLQLGKWTLTYEARLIGDIALRLACFRRFFSSLYNYFLRLRPGFMVAGVLVSLSEKRRALFADCDARFP